ncbi:MAG: sigma-70 family RNA polymerase sigma factor, partial [Chloroflexota bacterium]
NLPNYNRVGAFSSWLYRITVNAAIDRFRRRRNEASLDDLPRQGATYVASEHPEEDVIRQETRRALAQAVQELPPGARSALVLREYEQLAYSEIADILQIPIGTVMSRLNYARTLLREKLQEGRQQGTL